MSSLLHRSNESPVAALLRQKSDAVRYTGHLTMLLTEACLILEKLEVTVDVSEHLAHWWTAHKGSVPKGEIVENLSDSADPVPTGDRVATDGSGAEAQDTDVLPERSVRKTSF